MSGSIWIPMREGVVIAKLDEWGTLSEVDQSLAFEEKAIERPSGFGNAAGPAMPSGFTVHDFSANGRKS